jgi:hypothetical protein
MPSRRLPASVVALTLLLGSLLLGCSDALNPAVGPNAHVSIVTERPLLDLDSLVASLERDVYTTRVEQAFQTELVWPQSFDRYDDFKNLFLVAALDEDRRAAELVRRVVGQSVYEEFARGERPYAVYSDVYAAGQTVIVLAAPDVASLVANVELHADALYDTLEGRVQSALLRLLYLRGRNPLLQHHLSNRADWRMEVPRDYEVEQDVVRNMVIAFTPSPQRWIFVQSLPLAAEAFTPETVLRLREENPRLYEDEIIVNDPSLDEEVTVRHTTFAGRDAIRLEGRWQTPSFVVGGPFRLYAVHRQGRVYLVDFLVYLPAMDKYPYLRQLEAIASTFELVDAS